MALAFNAFDLAPGAFERISGQATRQGLATWLWPQVAHDEWLSARAICVDVLRDILTTGESPILLTGDPDVMSVAAYTAGLGPLIGWWLETGRVRATDDLAQLFDHHLRHNRIRMARMTERAAAVLHGLSEVGISATLLKGMHTAFEYFPDPGVRPVSDIDLLIDPADLPAANRYFAREGYMLKFESARECSWHAPGCEVAPRSLMHVHADDPWTVDIHHSLDYQPPGTRAVARLDCLRRPDVLRNSPILPQATVLRQPLLLLHLAAHAGSSLVSLSPLRMAELVLVARADIATRALDWGDYVRDASAAEALGIAHPALAMAERLAPGTVPLALLETSGLQCPGAVRRYLDARSPASIQGIEEFSLEGRYMWARDWRDALDDLKDALLPENPSWEIYSRRLATVVRWGRSRVCQAGLRDR